MFDATTKKNIVRFSFIFVLASVCILAFLFTIRPLYAQDALRPNISITSPTADSSYYSAINNITLSGTAADNQTLDRVVWKHLERGEGGTASGTFLWTIPSIALDKGLNTIVVTAYDTAGNYKDDYISVTFNLGANTVDITEPTVGDMYITGNSTVTLRGLAASGISTMEWENSSGGWGTLTASTSWASPVIPLQEGDNFITIRGY